MKNKIKYIKMSNGQELVAELEKENTFKDVCLISVVPGENNKPALSLSPYAFFTNEKSLTLPDKDVMFVTSANDELVSFYNQVTGKASIIKPESKGIILPGL